MSMLRGERRWVKVQTACIHIFPDEGTLGLYRERVGFEGVTCIRNL